MKIEYRVRKRIESRIASRFFIETLVLFSLETGDGSNRFGAGK